MSYVYKVPVICKVIIIVLVIMMFNLTAWTDCADCK